MRRRLALVAVAVLAAGACGADEEASGPTTSAPPTPEELAFCGTHIDTETAVSDAFADDAAPGTADDLEALLLEWQERAVDDVQDDVDTQVAILRDSLESGDTSFLDQGSEYREANDRVDAFLIDNCPADIARVSGTEYAYDGLVPELPANVPLGFVFTNDGSEAHELVLLRMEEGEEPVDMLDLPVEEQARRAGESHTFLLREPGGTDHHVVQLDAGRYAAVCFLPVGTTAPDELGDGPPHAAEGMIGEFTVG